MVVIRPYKPSDRGSIEQISYETAFLGDNLGELFVSRKLWTATQVDYYLNEEPDSVLVAEQNNEVIGYLFGCLDDKKKREYEEKHFPKWEKAKKIALFYIRSSSNTRYLINYYLFHYKKERFLFPKNAGHLHINLKKEYRGKGIGKMLAEEFFRYAKEKKTGIIHADSFLSQKNNTRGFWEKLGFHEFSRTKTSLWKKFFPKEDIYLVCYVKKIL